MEPQLIEGTRITIKEIISGLERGRDYDIELTHDNRYKLRMVDYRRRISNRSFRMDFFEIDPYIGTKIIINAKKNNSCRKKK